MVAFEEPVFPFSLPLLLHPLKTLFLNAPALEGQIQTHSPGGPVSPRCPASPGTGGILCSYVCLSHVQTFTVNSTEQDPRATPTQLPACPPQVSVSRLITESPPGQDWPCGGWIGGHLPELFDLSGYPVKSKKIKP